MISPVVTLHSSLLVRDVGQTDFRDDLLQLNSHT